MKKLQRGFTLIETFIILVVLAALIGGGYYIWHKDHNKKSTSTTATTTAPSGLQYAVQVPASFKTYIQPLYDAYKRTCEAPGSTSKTWFNVHQNVRDEFVLVGESCGSGADYLYVHQSGQWVPAGYTQDVFPCATIDKYMVSKTIAPTCATASHTSRAVTYP